MANPRSLQAAAVVVVVAMEAAEVRVVARPWAMRLFLRLQHRAWNSAAIPTAR